MGFLQTSIASIVNKSSLPSLPCRSWSPNYSALVKESDSSILLTKLYSFFTSIKKVNLVKLSVWPTPYLSSNGHSGAPGVVNKHFYSLPEMEMDDKSVSLWHSIAVIRVCVAPSERIVVITNCLCATRVCLVRH
jgi:hypothetical protein